MPGSQVTIYRDPAAVTVNVVDGVPPVDQSALVSQLQASVATLQGKLDRIKTARAAEEAGEHSADDARTLIDAEIA
jgi:hypothetical protein